MLVQRVVHYLLQPGTDGRVVAVADRLDQQFPQGLVVKGHLAQNIKHFAAQCAPFFFQFLEQPLEHHALTGLRRNQIPQVAHLGLPDAVDAAKTLLQTVRIPRQVVVYHQVGALKIDTFTGSIGGNEDAHLRVLLEQFLHLATLVPHHTAVDGHHSVVVPEQGADLIGQIAQGVPVLRKDD